MSNWTSNFEALNTTTGAAYWNGVVWRDDGTPQKQYTVLGITAYSVKSSQYKQLEIHNWSSGDVPGLGQTYLNIHQLGLGHIEMIRKIREKESRYRTQVTGFIDAKTFAKVSLTTSQFVAAIEGEHRSGEVKTALWHTHKYLCDLQGLDIQRLIDKHTEEWEQEVIASFRKANYEITTG